MNDSRTRSPEANVVFGACGRQEVVHLFVDVLCSAQILLTSNLGLDQVIAMDGGGRGDRGHASGHELEDSHLGSGILAGDSVGSEFEI
jgi:hypothetical protein